MLFCITANHTPNALNAMRENPKTDRKQAIEQLLKAAGGKLVGFYGTLSDACSRSSMLNPKRRLR